jgi:hypothetical protein
LGTADVQQERQWNLLARRAQLRQYVSAGRILYIIQGQVLTIQVLPNATVRCPTKTQLIPERAMNQSTSSHLDSGCWQEIKTGELSISMTQLKMPFDTSVSERITPKAIVSSHRDRVRLAG